MAFSVAVRDTVPQLAGKALTAMRGRLDRALRAAAPAVRVRVGKLCDLLIQRTPEWSSLLHGDLLGELGIPDVEARLAAVLRAIRDGVVVRALPVKVVGGRLAGGMAIGILRDDYEDLLGLAEASYVSRPSGMTIPWLEWLTVGGDQVLVYGHDVTFDLTESQRRRSRTGMALMVEGQGWRVPPEYAGNADDNWLLRAFDLAAVDARLAGIMHDEIAARLR